MSRATPMQTAYNGGELSPTMLGRPDHEIWPVALAECVGFAPRPQGPLEACPGFEFVAIARDACRLLAFEPYTSQAYVVEASDQAFRFFTNDVLIESEPGVPAVVAHPFTLQQVREMWTEQSVDVMYLFHRNGHPQELARTSASTFAVTPINFANGPFLERNTVESHTLAFSGVSGSVTVTASTDTFGPGDVGRLIEVEAEDLSDIPSWEPGIVTTINALLQWDGRVYQVVGKSVAAPTVRTGTVQPTHTRGTEWDGIGGGTDVNDKVAGGVQLLYLHDAFGRLRITAYTSATQVTATVTRRLPLQIASAFTFNQYLPPWFVPDGDYDGTLGYTNPGTGTFSRGTFRWRLGAYSDTTGWPSHGLVYNQRLFLFRDDRIDASVAGDLLNFDRLNEFGEVSVDQAFSLIIDDPNPIAWVAKGNELFIGTTKAEYVLRAASAASPMGPGNLDLKRQSKRGGAAGVPLDMDGLPIFVQRSGRKLLQLVEDRVGHYVPEDVTRYADHIGNSRFVEMAWQMEPLQLLWVVRADGTLACASYQPREAVLGWWRRPLGGGLRAESICAITAPDGSHEQLWVSAVLNGVRRIMVLGAWRNPGEVQPNPVMSDAALRYDGPPESVFQMTHLAGQTVEVVGNGAWLGEFMVADNGTLDLGSWQVSTAMAGLPFPAYFTVLPIEAGGDTGPAQGKMKRPSRVTLRLQDAMALQVERGGAVVQKILGHNPGDALDAALEPISDDVVLDIVGGWDRDGQFTVRRTAPLPSRVLAHTATVETSQR